MSDEKTYEHRNGVAGAGGETAETEHRDAARPGGEQRNELDPDRRNREERRGPRTHDDTRIDPDPRFGEKG
jgi:hypothetical protein